MLIDLDSIEPSGGAKVCLVDTDQVDVRLHDSIRISSVNVRSDQA
jgi:hypothetical protein